MTFVRSCTIADLILASYALFTLDKFNVTQKLRKFKWYCAASCREKNGVLFISKGTATTEEVHTLLVSTGDVNTSLTPAGDPPDESWLSSMMS